MPACRVLEHDDGADQNPDCPEHFGRRAQLLVLTGFRDLSADQALNLLGGNLELGRVPLLTKLAIVLSLTVHVASGRLTPWSSTAVKDCVWPSSMFTGPGVTVREAGADMANVTLTVAEYESPAESVPVTLMELTPTESGGLQERL